MVDLDSLQSAVVIDDPAEILRLFEKKPGPPSAELDADSGKFKISKEGSLIAKGSIPITTPKRLKKLTEARGMPWKEEYEGRSVPYFASDERVDGHGDIVRQSWQFETFEKNSPLQFAHEWWKPPIGRVVEWDVVQRKEADYKGPALYLLSLFATKDDWEWADTVFRLVQSRVMPMGSVGFFPGKVISIEDEDERTEIGLGRWGLIFEENELVEFSPCAIPANAGAGVINNALRTAKNKGSIQSWDIHVLRELFRQSVLGGENEREDWLRIENQLVSLSRTLWPDEEISLHRELDVPVTLTNVPRSRAVTGAVTVLENVEPDPTVVMLNDLSNRFGEFVSSTETVLEDIRAGLETPKPEPRIEDKEDDVMLDALTRTAERLELLGS